jgi:hypothetical protein
MRHMLWLASALLSCILGSQQSLTGQDSHADPRPHDVQNVLAALDFCKHQSMVESLGYEMNRLGDDVSANILRGMSDAELTKPENVDGYLCLARLAFWKPEKIERAEDRVPCVTVFILEYLKEREAHDEILVSQIDSVEAYVKEQTKEKPKTSPQ